MVGYGIIVASFLLKLPQLVKIVRGGSVAGLSRVSAYTEFLNYFHVMAYARHLGSGFAVYGETALISAQNFAVILAVYHYDKRVIVQEKVLFLGVFAMYATVLLAD